MDSEHKSTHCIEIPPALAKAIVAAQAAGESLRRDGHGDKGVYTTADEIAYAARTALTANGAAWIRLDVDLVEPGLVHADIGNQTYVGDLIERWAIVHEGGGVLLGSSRMPVIASRGRPHDKAVGASLTYDAGGALRGALCMDRESKDAIDRREDDHREPEPPKPKAQPKAKPPRGDGDGPTLGSTKKGEPLAKAIDALVEAVAEAIGTAPARVWTSVLKSTGVVAADIGALTFKDAAAVKAKLEAKLAESSAPVDAEALRKEAGRVYLSLCDAAPADFTAGAWKAEWSSFAKLDEWPDQPTAEQYQHAIAGMRRALSEIQS